MLFDDGSAQFHRALTLLLESREALGLEPFEVLDLDAFTQLADSPAIALTREERLVVLNEASFLLENFYCHLPFKRARYAIDPEQQLRLLARQHDQLSNSEFHSRILHIFASLRDVHTLYLLPEPYSSAAAFLPFTVRYFHENGKRKYEISGVMNGFDHPHFRIGAEITRWNGLTIDQAIERISDIAFGANDSARFLRGLQRLTVRPLRASLPPTELYVLIEYRAPDDAPNAEPRAILMPWKILSSFGKSEDHSSRQGSLALLPVLSKQAIRRIFFYANTNSYACFEPDALGPPPQYGSTLAPPPELLPQLPAQIDFQLSNGVDRPWTVPTSHLRLADVPDQNFAYIRLADFKLPTDDTKRSAAADAYRDEFRRILALANERAPNGLILDLRGNTGGDIPLAEGLLQYLTPREIEPSRFALRQSPLIQSLAFAIADFQAKALREPGSIPPNVRSALAEWKPWGADLLQAPFTGNPLTRAFPITDERQINLGGQIYQGPVLLITDGLTYSAGDFFVAGFQDNQIGPILGVQPSTGGGGANAWTHGELFANLKHFPGLPLRELPKGIGMTLSLRRSLRAGINAGQPLEDVGVTATALHDLSAEDVHNYNFDLLQRACRMLSELPDYQLRIETLERDPAPARTLRFRILTRGLSRVEASLTSSQRNLPQKAFAIPADGAHDLSLEMEALPPVVTDLTLRGYATIHRGRRLELAAETKSPLGRLP